MDKIDERNLELCKQLYKTAIENEEFIRQIDSNKSKGGSEGRLARILFQILHNCHKQNLSNEEKSLDELLNEGKSLKEISKIYKGYK